MTEDANTHSNAEPAEGRLQERAEATRATVVFGLVFFVLTAGVVWMAEYQPPRDSSWAPLAARIGVPLWVLLFLQACCLFLPAPFAMWHWFRLVFRAMSEGFTIGHIGILRLFVGIPRRHPDLRISRWIVLLILGGYLAALYTCSHLDVPSDSGRMPGKSQGRHGSGKVLEPAPAATGR